jgi:small subunit ribosomal protein S6
MPLYECVFIARQDIPSTQVEALAETFANVLAEGGGKVTKTEYWGLKSLAYRIKKNRKGHYVLMNVDAPYPAVAEMERQMGLNEDILRNMTIRVEALEEGPSAMMQSRGRDGDRRGDRGDRGDRGAHRADRETRQTKGDEE